MIYTAIDTFYLTDEQLQNSPSRKDGIDEATETTLRIYGCDLIQESGILLRLPQAVMATGQVLFHRFYCKKSFSRFNVKRVAASCVWLASKLEESPRKGKHVIIVFHRMECRRENLPIEHLDHFSKKYAELKMDLTRTERHLLKEMGFICHVEHPHKFISNYLATLETPPELRQEAWNLANDRSFKMFTARRKIQKDKDVEPTEFEESVAQSFFDLENSNATELKSELKDLYINSAVQVDVSGNRKAVVIHVPFRLRKSFRKIHVKLVRELEKRFSGKDVIVIASRRIVRPPKKGSAVQRPRNRTLTSVHDAVLEDVVYPAEIVGKRIKYRLDGTKLMKVFLDPKERNNTEYKLETFAGVYRKLCGKDVVFEYPVIEA